MNILDEETSLEIKQRLVQKLKVEHLILNWHRLSADLPLWNLTKLQEVYEDLIVTNREDKSPLLLNFSAFLSEQQSKVLMFPSDGYIASLDFDNFHQLTRELKACPIVEIDVRDLRKTREVRKWIIPEDNYFFDEDFSWLLFLCHEGFQVLCGTHAFIGQFKKYWRDYRNYVDHQWLEIFS